MTSDIPNINCEVCGVETANYSGKVKYCHSCRYKVKKKRNARTSNRHYQNVIRPNREKNYTRPVLICECGNEFKIYRVQRTMCGACQRKNGFATLRLKQKEAKEDGRCIYCFGDKEREDRVSCNKCAVIKAKKTKKAYAVKKKNKLCSKCSKPLEEGNKYSECFGCRERQYGEGKKYGTCFKPKYYINKKGKKVYYSQEGKYTKKSRIGSNSIKHPTCSVCHNQLEEGNIFDICFTCRKRAKGLL